jgi:hypothetical protein
VHREPYRPSPLKAARQTGRPDTTPQVCFADEIAIDFPSVGDVVDRMCHAFLGEGPPSDVLATQLRVSTLAARHGLTVPLEVPMRATCSTCNGRGGTWRDRCDRCSGTGESWFRHLVRVALPPGVADGARLLFRVTPPGAAVSVRVEVRVAVESSSAA